MLYTLILLLLGPVLADGRHIYLKGEFTSPTVTINDQQATIVRSFKAPRPGYTVIELQQPTTPGTVVKVNGTEVPNNTGKPMAECPTGVNLGVNGTREVYYSSLPQLADYSNLVVNFATAWPNSNLRTPLDQYGNPMDIPGERNMTQAILVGHKAGPRWQDHVLRLSWDDPSDNTSLGGTPVGDIVRLEGNKKYRDFKVNYQGGGSTVMFNIWADNTQIASTAKIFDAAIADPNDPTRPATVTRPRFREAMRGFTTFRDLGIRNANSNNVRTWYEMNRTDSAIVSNDFFGQKGCPPFTILSYEPIQSTPAMPNHNPNMGSGHQHIKMYAPNHGLHQADGVRIYFGPKMTFGGGQASYDAGSLGLLAYVLDQDHFVVSVWHNLPVDPQPSIEWTASRTGVNGVPFSTLVDLANETNVNLWNCAAATWQLDDFRIMARYAAQNLKKEWWLEGPNECWGWHFQQAHQAHIFAKQQDPPITSNEWYILYCNDLWTIAREEFVAVGRPASDVVRVIGGQMADGLNRSRYAALEKYNIDCDFIGLAPYHGGESTGGGGTPIPDTELVESSNVSGWISADAAYYRLDRYLKDVHFGPDARIKRGLALYEWGPGALSKSVQISAMAHRHPWVADGIYQTAKHFRDFCADRGIEQGPACFFEISGRPYGTEFWGAMEYDTQPWDLPAGEDQDLSEANLNNLNSSKMFALKRMMGLAAIPPPPPPEEPTDPPVDPEPDPPVEPEPPVDPPVTPPTTPKVSLTAEGQGYWRVFVNGSEISKHLQEREAAESATNAVLANPEAEVTYRHDQTVKVEVNGN